jgi:hypothetical protein
MSCVSDFCREAKKLAGAYPGRYLLIVVSEEKLLYEIEALRGQINREAGGAYDRQELQSACPISRALDQLLNQWFMVQAKKKNASNKKQA